MKDKKEKTMKDYQKCYTMYCEAKKDINEEPLYYEDWLHLEKEAEQEYRDAK